MAALGAQVMNRNTAMNSSITGSTSITTTTPLPPIGGGSGYYNPGLQGLFNQNQLAPMSQQQLIQQMQALGQYSQYSPVLTKQQAYAQEMTMYNVRLEKEAFQLLGYALQSGETRKEDPEALAVQMRDYAAALLSLFGKGKPESPDGSTE